MDDTAPDETRTAAAFAIGIDLGTTNCALAVAALGETTRAAGLDVPQLVAWDEIQAGSLLPSFVYQPSEVDLPERRAPLPWEGDSDRTPVVGRAAQVLGAQAPQRLVSSAKSWLCHGRVDRTAAILPWGADDAVEKLSPVAASALYLRHLREAWQARFPGHDPAHQSVVLTVPASFDESARELTVAAAERAGWTDFTLLEEPQAAFYHWLTRTDKRAITEALPIGATCVVIDCGGGTTDFSLIGVVEQKGAGAFRRLAVGDHLLLGGDNIDIALARHVEARLGPRRLDVRQWDRLVQDCRRVKETMLADDPPESMPVSVRGRGGKVVGASAAVELTRTQVHEIALDGFFPDVAADASPAVARGGLQEFGLPFVADPAVTRHLAAFLRSHDAAAGERPPAAVLFNGGLFNAAACRRRTLAVMRRWYGDDWNPKVLRTASFDLAVAHGAAEFGRIRAEGGVRVESAAARSYYVQVADAAAAESDEISVVCVVPHGMGEGQRLSLERPELELQLGTPVRFPMFTSTVRTGDRAGQVLRVEPDQLMPLPPLRTLLRGGKRSKNKRVAVTLEAARTDLGTVELHCVAQDGNNRWRLHFQTTGAGGRRGGPRAAGIAETYAEDELADAQAALDAAFGAAADKKDLDPVRGLPRALEQAFGRRRADWPTSLLRTVADGLLTRESGRRLSPDHEARWLNLAGFCLRPGWGHPLDEFLVEQFWKRLSHGPAHKADAVWPEFWTLWRRAAGGLDPSRQKELDRQLSGFVQVGRKPPRRTGSHEAAEMWRTLASLEHLPPRRKTTLGDTLLTHLERGDDGRHVLWALARLGSRTPLYGPVNVVVPATVAERWLERLLTADIPQSLGSDRDFALAQTARMTGDRALDVDEAVRERVLKHLAAADAAGHLVEQVSQTTERTAADEDRLLGDALPTGLQLVG